MRYGDDVPVPVRGGYAAQLGRLVVASINISIVLPPPVEAVTIMRVLLISANTEKLNMPTLPMGLGFVAAAASASGRDVHFLDLLKAADPQAAIEDALSRIGPEVIGISIRNVDDQTSTAPRFLLDGAKKLVATCKRASTAPVVLGGAGYSLFPEAALDYLHADMGIQGEGEDAFVAVLERLESHAPLSDVPGLFLRGKGLQAPRAYHAQLDDWPFPDPRLFDAALFQDPSYYLPFQTRRGCPLKCSYCATAAIEGPHLRKHSPQVIVRELDRWRRAGFSRIFFVDNTFNLPPVYALQLCRLLSEARLGLNWRCILYPGSVTAELVEAMARAGCAEVSLGFESGNRQVLAGMRKHFAPEDVEHAARLLGNAGIRRMGFLLLGGPDETRASVLESLKWVDSLQLEMVKLTVGIRIYPYTRLAAIARAEGVVDRKDNLLRPRFYITRGLEDWLRQTVSDWAARRSNWVL
jgi:radical SAM superfamily enzyme YgiQ (UPF0313 family)